jgi:DNA-binding NarL/FixJ family response regulator
VGQLRILLGELPTVVRGTLNAAIRAQSGIEVVGDARGPTELLLAAGRLRPDAFIIGASGGELPGIATHLLDQYPTTTVVAVAPDGCRALLYALRPRLDRIECSSLDELVRQVRDACEPA